MKVDALRRAAGFLVLVAMTVCTGVAQGGGGPSAVQAAQDETLALSFVARSPKADLVDVYIAEAEGIFERNHLDVSIQYGNPVTAYLVSGEADVVKTTTLEGIMLAIRDFPVSHFLVATLGNGLPLISSPSVESLEGLQALDNCVLATYNPGSNSTAYVNHYIELLGLECQTDQVSSIEVAVAGIISERYTATVLGLDFAEQIAAEGGHILIDPRDSEYDEVYGMPGPTVSTDFFATPEMLEEKREELTRFTRSILEAQELRLEMPIPEIAAAMQSAEQVYRATDLADIEVQLEATLPSVSVGPITEELWNLSLEVYELYGVEDYDSTAPVIAFESAVDHSLYDAASTPQG